MDPLELAGDRGSTTGALRALPALGIHEARCYASNEGTHASRMDAIAALVEQVAEAHAAG